MGGAAAHSAGASRQRRPSRRGEGVGEPAAAGASAAAAAGPDVVMGSQPEQGATEGVRVRRYCPVVGCPEGNYARAQGWTDPVALRRHMECHASGRLAGDVRRDWMIEHEFDQCSVCSRLLTTRYGGACPGCRASLGADTAGPARGPRDIPYGVALPELCVYGNT